MKDIYFTVYYIQYILWIAAVSCRFQAVQPGLCRGFRGYLCRENHLNQSLILLPAFIRFSFFLTSFLLPFIEPGSFCVRTRGGFGLLSHNAFKFSHVQYMDGSQKNESDSKL